MVAMIKTPQSLILQFPGNTRRIDVDTVAATKALELLRNNATDEEILAIVDPLISIRKHTSGIFNVNDSGEVFVGEDRLPDVLAGRLVDFAEDGLLDQAQALVNFWNNCLENPDDRARTDLYAFLEHNGIPVTKDGCFIAYRGVARNASGDLVDCHTGKFVNNVGCVVEMSREECDANPDQTCSRGLHVAAFEYARGFGRVLIEVKVNPRDVVAIPTDYNGQKMRTCRFEVVAINAENAYDGTELNTPLYDVDEDDEDGGYYDTYEEDDEFSGDEDDLVDDMIVGSTKSGHDGWKTQARDSHGRFLPKN